MKTAEQLIEELGIQDLDTFMESAEFEQLDELSKKTLGNYLRRNADSRSSIAKDKGDIASTRQKLSDADWSLHIDDEDRVAINKARNKLLTKGEKLDKKDLKRQIGHHRAISKLTKESIELNLEDYTLEELQDFMMSEDFEQLDELSKETLTSYIDKAKDARRKHVGTSVAADLSDGIKKAIKKLSNKKLTKESIESLVSAVLDGDQESASAVFNQAMSEKISSRMDSIKQEIASGL